MDRADGPYRRTARWLQVGVDGAHRRLPFTSTEHNTDLVCLFGRLARLTGDRVWLERRGRVGVVSASSPLDTGFGFGYYPYRHTGATAWYVMAATRFNPLQA